MLVDLEDWATIVLRAHCPLGLSIKVYSSSRKNAPSLASIAMTALISLTEEFASQQERCRKLLVTYRQQYGNPIAMYRAWKLEQTLQEAAKAAVTGKFLDMYHAYKSMEECE